MRIFVLVISILIVILVAAALALLIINAPAEKAGSVEAKNFKVLYSQFPDASRLSVKATFSYGSVQVTESEDENLALATDFISFVETLNPDLRSVVDDGELIVEYDASQTVSKIIGDGKVITHDIKIGGPKIPKKLKVDFGAGDIRIFCINPTLISTDVNGGAGNIVVDYTRLSGREGKVNTRIDLGVGKVTVIVPRGAGLKYNLESGIGSVNFGSKDNGGFMNSISGMSDDYAENKLQVDLKVNTGIGQVLIIEK